MNNEDQNKQIKDLRIELMFDYFTTAEMKIFHHVIETAREKMQRENKAGESFDAYVRGLEINFDEYLQTWTEVFKEYRGKASIKHVRKRIPNNVWLRLQNEALSESEIEELSDVDREYFRQQLSRDLKKRLKKLDTV